MAQIKTTESPKTNIHTEDINNTEGNVLVGQNLTVKTHGLGEKDIKDYFEFKFQQLTEELKTIKPQQEFDSLNRELI